MISAIFIAKKQSDYIESANEDRRRLWPRPRLGWDCYENKVRYKSLRSDGCELVR